MNHTYRYIYNLNILKLYIKDICGIYLVNLIFLCSSDFYFCTLTYCQTKLLESITTIKL